MATGEATGMPMQLDSEYAPRKSRTYLITRWVGRIASSLNEQTLDGSLDPFASRHDRYRLESRGYKSRWRAVLQGSSSELECRNVGGDDLVALEGGDA